MAKEIKRWITVNGKHIPIYEGESVKEAISRSTSGKKTEKEDTRKKSAARDDDDEDSGAQDASGRHLTNKEFREQYDPEEAKKAQIEALKKRAAEKKKEIDQDELMEIVDKYNATSKPVSGSWDTETEHEQKTIADHFGISMDEAKQVMKDQLGFDDDMFKKTEPEGKYDIGGNPVYSKEEREAFQKQDKERANSEHAKNLVKEFEESNRKFEEQAYGKKESAEPEGKKTYRVHYEDGNQRLLEVNSKEELDAYLKDTESRYGKATKFEHAPEYDKKDTLKSTDLPVGKKESHGGSFEADLEEHSDPEYKNVTKGVKTEKQTRADLEKMKQYPTMRSQAEFKEWLMDNGMSTNRTDFTNAEWQQLQLDYRKQRNEKEKSIKIGNKEVGVKKELTPSELEAKARRDSAAEDTRSRRKYMQNIKAGNGTVEDYGNLNYTQSSKLTLGQLKQIAKNAGLEVPGYYNKDDIKRMLQKVWNSK